MRLGARGRGEGELVVAGQGDPADERGALFLKQSEGIVLESGLTG
jgi:hypothetical protein